MGIYYRFTDELSDAKFITGLMTRFTDDADALDDALDNDE